ncbi:MAG: hypothetical protein ACK56C_01825 [Alphaproteobacteria bacterium]
MIERSASLGPLRVSQSELKTARLRDRYDLCVSISSWEERATTAFAALPARDGRWEVWTFATSDPDRAKAKAKCLASLRSLRREPIEAVQLAGSLQYEKNFELLQKHVAARSLSQGKPLDLLFDMTCMPKKYILFILGMAFRNEYVRSIDFIYSEGAYKPASDIDPAVPMSWSSSEGEWSSVQVPYLEADNFMPDARGLIVSLGAEISASVPFIERYEPARISLISVQDEPTRIDTGVIEKERRLLRELETLPTTTSQTLSLEDLLGVAESCRTFCRQRPDMSVTGLAIGAKPHALALGLAALSVPNLEIVCRLPSKYLSGDVVPTGRIFVYSAEDPFEPR